MGCYKKLLIGCFLLFSYLESSYAQSIWIFPEDGSQINLEYIVPSFKLRIFNNEIESQTFTLSGRIKLSSGRVVKIEIPYTMVHIDEYEETYTFDFGGYIFTYTVTMPEINSKSIGNLYIGMEFPTTESNYIDVGLRLPTASKKEEGLAYAGVGDYDRLDAYMPNYITLNTIFNLKKDQSNPLILHFRFGPNLMIYNGSSEETDKVELLLKTSLLTGIRVEKFEFLIGYSGVFSVTEKGDISNRLIHQFGCAANLHFRRIHPTIYYRVPLDKNLSKVIFRVLGIALSYEF